MNLTLHVWRQKGPRESGRMVEYAARNISPDMSFLEMLDVVNQGLVERGEEPIAFDHDCREGICGSCCLMINGRAHGPERGVASCQTYMRHFQDGDEIYVEPWRARAFPVIKDLVVDRTAFDRIIQAGGYIAAPTGSPAMADFSRPARTRTAVVGSDSKAHRHAARHTQKDSAISRVSWPMKLSGTTGASGNVSGRNLSARDA